MPTELAVAPPAQIATQPSAMDLLHMAVEKGASIDTIERLAKLQQQMMQRDAEMAFSQALHSCQQEIRRIGTNAENSGKKYVTFTKLDAVLRPIYSRHGFSVSFNTADGRSPDSIKIIAYVSHNAGHTREYSIDMPADGKGARGNDVMTRTHATGSAVSYGKRYLEASIFNVTVGDTDDDGNAASGKAKVDESQVADYCSAMESATTEAELKSAYVPAYRYAQSLGDREAMQQIRGAYERQKVAINA